MRRRDVLALLSGAAGAWPLAARAQPAPGRQARIGYLVAGFDNPTFVVGYRAFLDELRKHGFADGQNLTVERRSLGADASDVFANAADLVSSNVEVLVTGGPEISLQAAIATGGATPIVVIAHNYNPIERGYATSLARPGGIVTGVFALQTELAEKQLELLTRAFPELRRVAILYDAFSADQLGAARRAAGTLRLEIDALKLASPPYDFEAAITRVAGGGGRMLLVLSSPFFMTQRVRIASAAVRHRLPSMFMFRQYVEAGGLMSYGPDVAPIYRRAGEYVARILKGADPGDLPIERAATFELVINLKTAKALGLEVAPDVLARADEVIE
jgi:putative ABC transport system substrate-binding protein